MISTDALLIFSPQFFPFLPPTGVSYLSSYLKKHGIKVEVKDLNIELFDHLLSRRYFQEMYRQSEKKATEEFSRAIDDHFIQDLMSEINNAKKALKNQKTYTNYEELSRASVIVQNALEAISEYNKPFSISLVWGNVSCNGDLNDLKRFMKSNTVITSFIRNKLEEYIKQYDPRLIGLSVGDNPEIALSMAAYLKEKFPQIPVVLGGPGISVTKPVFMEKSEYFECADFMVVFDGEEAVMKLVQALKTPNFDASSIPNIMYRNRTNRKIICSDIKIMDEKKIPAPDFSWAPIKKYLTPGLILPVETGRGCYWNQCTFCDRPKALSPLNISARRKEVNQVIEELSILKQKWEPEYIFFVDDCIPPEYLIDISRAILKEKIPIKWIALTRFNKILTDRDAITTLKKAGCCKLGFGLESAVPRVIARMKKGIKIPVAEEVIKNCFRHGISLHIWGIAGFPTETYSETLVTLDFFKRLKPFLDSPGFSYQITPFVLDYYSKINEKHKKFGISERNYNDHVFLHFYKSIKVKDSYWPFEPELIAKDFMRRINENLTHKQLPSYNSMLNFFAGVFRKE